MVDSFEEYSYYIVAPKNFKPNKKCHCPAIYKTKQESDFYVLSGNERVYQVLSQTQLTEQNIDGINMGKEMVAYSDNHIQPKQPKKIHVLKLGNVVRA